MVATVTGRPTGGGPNHWLSQLSVVHPPCSGICPRLHTNFSLSTAKWALGLVRSPKGAPAHGLGCLHVDRHLAFCFGGPPRRLRRSLACSSGQGTTGKGAVQGCARRGCQGGEAAEWRARRVWCWIWLPCLLGRPLPSAATAAELTVPRAWPVPGGRAAGVAGLLLECREGLPDVGNAVVDAWPAAQTPHWDPWRSTPHRGGLRG